MNSFEYVASGTSYMRLIFGESYEDPECKEYINNCFSKMQNKGDHHSFSLLYNSWTESKFGEVYKEHYRKSLDKIYCDSGGLQILTTGKLITDKEKFIVYKNQSKSGDIGLSFDEIPVSFTGEKTARLDLSNRWFDSAKFDECAKLTGKNVADQIQTFLDEKSTCKPMFITQGNSLETYQRWTELALKEIPKDHHQYISGVAMGAAALGFGGLEDIKRAFYYTQLPIETGNNHLHLLAVGSVYRLLPNIVFAQNGVYENIHISYDSTTHTSGIATGRYYAKDKATLFPQHFDKKIWGLMYNDVYSKGFEIGLNLKDYHESMNTASLVYKTKHGSRIPLIKSYVATTLASITNFIDQVEKCYSSKDEILKLADERKSFAIMKSLYEVKNLDDWNFWEREVSRYVKSNNVKPSKKMTLDAFFD